MSEELERRPNRWFLYRNPTPSTLEIWTRGEDKPYFCKVDEDYQGDPIMYWPRPDYIASSYHAKIAHKDELEDMLETVKMLAKWKRSHEEK